MVYQEKLNTPENIRQQNYDITYATKKIQK